MTYYSEHFLREFFQLYKEQECLWKVKSELYHNRRARRMAMDILISKFQEVNEEASEDFVKKKINNFRTSYRRELKLVQNSIKSGKETDDIYKPKLWYFGLLSFLNDQEVPREPVSNYSDEEEVMNRESRQTNYIYSPLPIETEDSQLSLDSTISINTPYSFVKTPSMSKKRSSKTSNPRDELLITINKKLQQSTQSVRENDRFDIFGNNVTVKLRSLPNNQRIIAEKLINDVLFEAECNNLSRGWQLLPPPPTTFNVNGDNHDGGSSNNTPL